MNKNKIQIKDGRDLVALSGRPGPYTAVLENDIDLTDKEFKSPAIKCLDGEIDGRGHKIRTRRRAKLIGLAGGNAGLHDINLIRTPRR